MHNLYALCLILWCALSTQACSPPMGWQTWQPEPRIAEADIAIYGKISALDTEPIPGRINPNDTNNVITIDVYCILRNTKQADIGESITILEEDVRSSGRCVNNMVNVQLGKKGIILLTPDRDDNTKLVLSNINVQSAIIEASDDTKTKIVDICGVTLTEVAASQALEETCTAFPEPNPIDPCKEAEKPDPIGPPAPPPAPAGDSGENEEGKIADSAIRAIAPSIVTLLMVTIALHF